MNDSPRHLPRLLVDASALALLFALWTGVARAQPQQRPEGPPRGGPPPEALVACKSLAAGNACSFTGREARTVKGTCWAPEGKPLACRPADAPPPQQQQQQK